MPFLHIMCQKYEDFIKNFVNGKKSALYGTLHEGRLFKINCFGDFFIIPIRMGIDGVQYFFKRIGWEKRDFCELFKRKVMPKSSCLRNFDSAFSQSSVFPVTFNQYHILPPPLVIRAHFFHGLAQHPCIVIIRGEALHIAKQRFHFPADFAHASLGAENDLGRAVPPTRWLGLPGKGSQRCRPIFPDRRGRRCR